MAQVIWTEIATQELEAIAVFLNEYSESYAKAVVKRLYERTGQLAGFPEMGRIIPEINNPRFRELIEGNYRLMYEVLNEDLILVQRIIHQSRNFKP